MCRIDSSKAALVIALLASVVSASCDDRYAGQVESFSLDTNHHLGTSAEVTLNTTRNVIPRAGDPIRFNSDPLTIIIEGVNIDHLPPNVVGSHDVIVFAEIWEDAATAVSYKPLVGVAYVGHNVLVPGRLNFDQAIAYGPTRFKGHPLKIKFTVEVLVKDKVNQATSATTVAEGLVGAALPEYSAITSVVASLLKDILKSQPDVVGFDFETTLLSDAPEGMLPTLNEHQQAVKAANDAVNGANQDSLRVPLANRLVQAISNLKQSPNATADQLIASLKAKLNATRPQATTIPVESIDKQDIRSIANATLPPSESTPRTFAGNSAWLGYGQYALVETLPQALEATFSDDWHLFNDHRSLDPSIVYDRGFLWKDDHKLKLNYVVFRVEPSQPTEDDDALRAAAAANDKLVQSLLKPTTDIAEAAKDIDKQAAALKTALDKTRLESRAASAARANPDNQAAFDKAYAQKAKEIQLSGGDSKIIEEVQGEWDARYASSTAATTTEPTTQP